MALSMVSSRSSSDREVPLSSWVMASLNGHNAMDHGSRKQGLKQGSHTNVLAKSRQAPGQSKPGQAHEKNTARVGSRKRSAPTSLPTNQQSSSRTNQSMLEQLVAELVPSMPLVPLDPRALISAAATSPTRLTARGTVNIDNRNMIKGEGKGQAGRKNNPPQESGEGGRASPSRAEGDAGGDASADPTGQGASAEHASERGSVGGTQQAVGVEVLPPSVLFEDRSSVPRATIDLTAWALQLREASLVRHIASQNPVFTGLVLLGPSLVLDDRLMAQVIGTWAQAGIQLATVDLSGCQLITDATIKALALAFAGHVTRLVLSHCDQVTDRGLGFLARWCPNLQHLELQGCGRVGGGGLTQLAKHCPRLAKLNLANCNGINDRGLQAVSEHLSLEELDVSHCRGLSDVSLAHFLAHVKRIKVLSMAGMAQLTDGAISPMHETPVIYGTKKCDGCKQLTRINVEGCTGLSSVLHAHLLGSTSRLSDLCLRSCPALLALQAVPSLAQLSSLTRLDLSCCPSLDDDVMERLTAPRPRCAPLTWLDVSDGGRLSDRGLGLLAEAYPNLTYLSLQRNARLTDGGVEVLVRRCPVLKTLRLSGLTLLTDRSVAILTVLHKGIRMLDLAGCSRLSDGALQSLGDCRQLECLDLSDCRGVGDRGVARLSSVCLTELRLRRLPLLTDQGLQALANKLHHLHTLDLAHCPQVTLSGLEVLVSSCPSLTSLNAEGCDAIDLSQWRSPPPQPSPSQPTSPSNPAHSPTAPPPVKPADRNAEPLRGPPPLLSERFLGVVEEPGFVGLRVTDRYARQRHLERQRLGVEHNVAAVLQAWYRKRLDKKRADANRKFDIAKRTVAIRLLQAAIRGYRVRKRVEKARKVWRQFLPKFRFRLLLLWTRRGERHFANRAGKRGLQVLREHAQASIRQRRKAEHKAKSAAFWRRMALRKQFDTWRDATDDGIVERFHTEVAMQHFYEKMKPQLFRQWVTKTHDRQRRRDIMRGLFLNCVPATAENSAAALERQKLADAYRGANLVAPAFWALRHATFELSPMRGLKEMAEKHFRALFFNTTMRKCYVSWVSYLLFRRNKKIQLALAQHHYIDTILTNAVSKLRLLGRMRRLAKTRRLRKMGRVLRKLKLNVDARQDKKRWMVEVWKALRYFNRMLADERGLIRLEENRVRRVDWRAKNAKARAKFRRTTLRRVFGVWSDYQEQLRLFLVRIDATYAFKLQARIWGRFVDNTWELIEERQIAEAAEREARRLAEEARIRFKLETKAAVRIQARYRVMHYKKAAEKWRVFRDWAVIKTQQQARVFLAKRRMRRLARHRRLAEAIREEKERDLMYPEDLEAAYARRYDKAAAIMNRLVRGLLGRLRLMRRRAEHARELGIELNVKVREAAIVRMKLLRAEREEREGKLLRASTVLQRLWRGLRARRRVASIKHERRKAALTTRMQAIYRMLLAMRQAAAIRRHRANMAKVRRSRRVSGAILRFLRYPDRYSQRRFVDMLGRMGLDPRDYQLDMVRQLEEMRGDAILAVKEMSLEAAVWKHGRFDAYARSLYREAHIKDYLPVVVLENRDPVRVVLRSHKLFGYTAMVVRVDRDVPNKPLLELKMDHSGKIAYLPYYQGNSKQLSVAIIESMKRPPMDAKAVLANADKLVEWGKQECERIRPEKAALKIQKAYRCHIARKFVARGRYDHWMQIRNKRYAILNLLDSMGGLNSRSAYLLEYWRIFTQLELPKTYPNALIPPEMQHRLLVHRYRRSVEAEYAQRAALRRRYIEERREEVTSEVLAVFRPFSMSAKLSQDVREAWASLLVGRRKGWDGDGCAPAVARWLLGRDGKLSRVQLRVWVARYQFMELTESPHVRANGHALYHGMWKGHPALRSFVPHGEGVAEFFDCWAVAKEERTLRITVIRARELLAPLEGESRMFTTLECNGKALKTTHKRGVFPQWDEVFELDVTYGDQAVVFNVFDYDGRLTNEHLGRTEFKLSALPYREKVQHWLKLTDKKGDSSRNLGELLVELFWFPKVDAHDMVELQEHEGAVRRLQTWWRGFYSKKRVDAQRKVVAEQTRFITAQAVKLQGFARIILARVRVREVRKERRLHRKLHRALRRLRLMRSFIRIVKRTRGARLIQAMFRHWKARKTRRETREARVRQRFRCVANMQRRVRRQIARRAVGRIRDAAVLERPAYYQPAYLLLPVADWLSHYGTEPGYPSKRSARICRRAIKAMLSVPGTTVHTRYGLGDVLTYPLPRQRFRHDEDQSGGMALVLLRTHRWDSRTTRHELAALLTDRVRCPALYKAYLSLERGVDILATLAYRACRLQCRVRIWRAIRHVTERRRRKRAARMIQRNWRHKRSNQDRAARVLQRRMLGWHARCQLRHKKKEVVCALALQCAYRVFAARKEAERRRCVPFVRALACSTRLDERFKASNTVDRKPDTLWISRDGRRDNQWIVYDLQRPVNIGKLVLQGPGDTSCPRFVIVRFAETAAGPFLREFMTFSMDLTKRPQHFHAPARTDATARFWRLDFLDNHGSSAGISLVGVTFVMRREETACVMQQPDCVILDPAPDLGTRARVQLTCSGGGWPLPAYQWQLNDVDIEGATQPTLEVEVGLEPASSLRTPFRCFHCRKISHRMPTNVAQIVCMTCHTPFDYPEFHEKRAEREALDAEMKAMQKGVKEVHERRARVEAEILKIDARLLVLTREGNLRASQTEEKRAISQRLRDARKELLSVCKEEEERQLGLAALLSRRLEESDGADPCKAITPYNGVGVYRCVVSNLRGGGTYKCRAPTHGVAVYATLPSPFSLKVWETYRPRKPVRRRTWDMYGTISGHFENGRVGGDVVIRYKNGHVYEGPYVEETWLDSLGRTVPQGRRAGHWGRWTTPDRGVYEGRLVDNHFNLDCKQGELRMVRPDGEMYEGMFVDDLPHGMGEMTYADGSRYVGEWFRGLRQGFGLFRTADGSSYEGEWDHGLVSGEGIWRWRDGVSYVGCSLEGKRHGKGLYATPAGDVYKGDFVANKMEGRGTFTYRDGSSYEGEFKGHNREGQGCFINSMGVEFEGPFLDDRQHGVFVVRRPIVADERDKERGLDHWGPEEQRGVWEHGVFQKWLGPAINPKATWQFHAQYEAGGDEEYDGVTALLLAKNLPFLPPGVDPDNPRVQRVLERIRNEAGELVGHETIRVHRAKVAELEPQVTRLSRAHGRANEKLVRCKKVLDARKEAVGAAEERHVSVRGEMNELALHVEQYWLNDLSGSREALGDVLARMGALHEEQWFMLRQYGEPPPMVWKVLQCVLTLLAMPEEWGRARLLLGDSRANRDTDEMAMVEEYRLKLVHYMSKQYDVYAFSHEVDMQDRAEVILKHPRFASDNLAIQAYGMGLATLVDFCKALHMYVLKSKGVHAVHERWLKARDRTLKFEAEVKYLQRQVDETQAEYDDLLKIEREAKDKWAEVEARRAESARLVALCEGMVTQYLTPEEANKDYYQKQLDEIETDPRAKVEAVMESLLMGVEGRLAKAQGSKAWKPRHVDTKALILQELPGFRDTLAAWVTERRDPKDKTSYEERREQLVSDLMAVVLAELNQVMREEAECVEWVMLDGRRVGATCVDALIRQAWADADFTDYVHDCINKWEGVWGEKAAYMAVQARISTIMSDEVKEQAGVWALYHPNEVKEAEENAASNMEVAYPIDTAKAALQLRDDYTRGLDSVTMAHTWALLNPDAVREALEELAADEAELFERQYPIDTAAQYVALMRQGPETLNPVMRSAADKWAALNRAEVAEEEAKVMALLGERFERTYPVETAVRAAEVVEGLDTSASAELREQAVSWNMLHPREAKKEQRRVRAHMAHVIADKLRRIKELQFSRRSLLDELHKKRGTEAAAEEEPTAEQQEAAARLKEVEGELRTALRERRQFCEKKLEETRNRLRDVRADRLYLHVSRNIRPSERLRQLGLQKREHDTKIRTLEAQSREQEEGLASLDAELETLGSAEEEAPQGEGEWTALYDEASGAWYYQHNVTGETKWAE